MLLGLSCKNKDYPYSRCFPYKVSDRIVNRTEYSQNFDMITCIVNADVEYHVLPDEGMQSYITIEGPDNIVKKVGCTTSYNSYYNMMELNLSYDRCVSRKRNPKLKVHIFGHKLSRINTTIGNFISKDTLQSKEGVLSFLMSKNSSIDIVLDARLLNVFLPNSAVFKCHGKADSCQLVIWSLGGIISSPAVDIDELLYNMLDYDVQSGEYESHLTNIYIGRPDTIYYRINEPNFNTYYQGDPVLIDRGSRYFTLFKKD